MFQNRACQDSLTQVEPKSLRDSLAGLPLKQSISGNSVLRTCLLALTPNRILQCGRLVPTELNTQRVHQDDLSRILVAVGKDLLSPTFRSHKTLCSKGT